MTIIMKSCSNMSMNFCIVSVAILKYLADKNKVADHWYPADLQKRALVDRYLAWQHLGLRLLGSMVFRIQVSLFILQLSFCIVHMFLKFFVMGESAGLVLSVVRSSLTHNAKLSFALLCQ